MPARTILIKLCALTLFAVAAGAATNTPANSYKGAQCYDPKLTPQERAGCEIWFYATAGNARFHAYVLPQRLPVLLDWYRVLNSKQRSDRFRAWGIINDPSCCVPGTANCIACGSMYGVIRQSGPRPTPLSTASLPISTTKIKSVSPVSVSRKSFTKSNST